MLATEIKQDFGSIYIRIDPVHAKDAHLDYCYRMKQGGHRSRSDHGSRQPGMKWHQPGLGKSKGEQGKQGQLAHLRKGSDFSSVGQKIHRDLPTVQPDIAPTQSGQQKTKGGK